MSDLTPPNWTLQERALAASTARATVVPVRVREVWSPQTCPLDLLPWLAWALHVDSWDAAWPEQIKRNVVAASIEIHRRKGTIGALKRALQAVGYEVHIDEATGVPYTFRLQVDVTGGGGSEELYSRVEKIALENKNVRSHLLGVDALMKAEGNAYVSSAVVTGEDTSVYPLLVRELSAMPGLYVAAVEHTQDFLRVFPLFSSMLEASANASVSGLVRIEITL
ncbi:MAG TPA: phage tail protein I [Chthoniobacteraceae bacterium]|nr:phage tail protein I [Chthoniobacteraceae bacterium]